MNNVRYSSPPELGPVLGPYSHISRTRAGELVIIAGQLGCGADGVAAAGFEAQCKRVYENIGNALKAIGADWSDILQFTSYLIDPQDIAAFMAFRGTHFPAMFGDKFPPNTLLVIQQLVDPAFRIEVTTMVALP